MLTDEDEDVGDPEFDLDALPGDGPNVDESVNVSNASFEEFKALEGNIRPLPHDGDCGILQPQVNVRWLQGRELGVGKQGGGKGFLINEPSIFEDKPWWPYYVWPPIVKVRLIWIRVVEYRQLVGPPSTPPYGDDGPWVPIPSYNKWERFDTFDSMYLFPFYTSVRQFALEVMKRYAPMSFHEDYRTTCRIVEQGENFPDKIDWELTYSRAPHRINNGRVTAIEKFWINPFQRIWHGEYMDDVFHLYDECDRCKPICVWLWNACTYGLPRSPPCASAFRNDDY